MLHSLRDKGKEARVQNMGNMREKMKNTQTLKVKRSVRQASRGWGVGQMCEINVRVSRAWQRPSL